MNKEAKILLALAIGTVAILVGGAFLFNKSDSTKSPETAKVYSSELLVNSQTYHRGSDNPKVTIVEFGDFQCPACGASEPIVEEVLNQYKDSVSFVFRHFPLEQHKNAFNAARAVEAAGEQGKFWELHDLLYAKQDEWGERDNAMTLIEGYAKELGLDMDKFKKAISEKKYDDRINQGLTDGTAVGVNATPTFYVNGKKQSGLLTTNQWKTLLDQEISDSSK